MQTKQYEDELKHISLSQISVNPSQPRREFKKEELEELARSICTVGLLHPPLVRPLPSGDMYELISGERRFRAAQLASLSFIPVYVRSLDFSLSAQAALIENIQRVNLNPLEIAEALDNLIGEFAFTQEHLAKQLGKKRSTIANYLRLLSLPPLIQESLKKELISMGHGKAILSLAEERKQHLLHDMIIKEGLTVRQAERMADKIGKKLTGERVKSSSRDCHLEELSNRLREKLGSQVRIETKGKGGHLTVEYHDLDDLDRLLSILGISQEI